MKKLTFLNLKTVIKYITKKTENIGAIKQKRYNKAYLQPMNTFAFFTVFQSNKVRRIFIFFCCLCGFTASLFLFYPGFISPDSLDQFTQALHGDYGNWHPPIMAGFWHLLLNFYVGPQPMLIFQQLLLWVGAGFLAEVIFKRLPLLSPLLFLLLAAPYVQNVAGNIWKDLHMSLSYFLAISLLIFFYFEKNRPKPWQSTLILLLIFYGTWVRVSGFPGSIPLLFLWFRLSFPSAFGSKRRVAVGIALVLAFSSLQLEKIISRFVLQAHDDHIEYKLIAHDLTGLSMRSRKLLFPPEIKSWKGFDTAYLFSHYQLMSFDNIWWNPDHKQILPNLTELQHKSLQAYWRAAILSYLPQYLKMKYEGSLYFIKIRESGNGMMIMHPYIKQNNFGFKLEPNSLRDKFFYRIEVRQYAWYMVPWYWMMINLLFLLLAFLPKLRTHRELLMVLACSALFYLIVHFFVYPADTELRYFYWYSLCTSLSVIFTISCWFLPREKSPD